MRYLKRFNEGNLTSTLTSEMVAELRDFCQGYLSYLLDDGFGVQITPTFNGTECDVIFYKTDVFHSSTRWSRIKDHFIPFLYMLNKHYKIINSSQDCDSLSIQPDMVSDIINDDNFTSRYGGSFRDDKVITKIKIRVDFKDQSITEAISQEDIKDFCEQYLAYLLDDGYALAFRESGRITQVDFVKPQDNPQPGFLRWSPRFGGTVDWMDWDHIKDRFIPFLQMLDKQYDVKDNLITFQCPNVQIRIPFRDVINDKVKDILHDKLTLDNEDNLFDEIDSSDKISSIKIAITDHSVKDYSWQVKEAKEDWRRNFPDDELQEVCDTFLPYLYDEGFVVQTTVQNVLFKKNFITLWKEQEKGDGQGLHIIPFHWDEIKDRFLPLFDYLNNNYPLGKIILVGYQNSWEDGKKKEVIFKSDGDRDSWVGHPFSKFEEIMSRDATYSRPMKIGEIIIEVQNLDEL